VTRWEKFSDQLHPEFAKLYWQLKEELPNYWFPYCGIRTFAEQAKLYAQGRTMPGRIVTHAPPGTSAHQWGCAVDLTVFENGKPIWMEKSDDRWRELSDACAKIQLVWGGNFSSIQDYVHCELKLVFSWSDVLEVFRDCGIQAANDFISNNLGRL